MSEPIKVTEIFGEDVFNDTVMQERLPKKVYKDLKKLTTKKTQTTQSKNGVQN